MANPLLSIAIPAYDRPKELRHSLERFIEQIEGRYEDEIEIRISDDCSPNNSLNAIEELCQRYSFLHFRRYDRNVGLEKNLIKSAEECRGEYLWLFGDDDYLEGGEAMSKIIPILRSGEFDMLVLNRTRRSFASLDLLSENWMGIDRDLLKRYNGLRSFCLDFGFISVIGFVSVNIFRRQPFARLDFADYFGTMYPQLGGMVEAFHERPVLLVGDPLVCHRTQSQEEKRQALADKASESEFMSDVRRRNALYFSYPYIKMIGKLMDAGAFDSQDIVRIPENTVIDGKLIDFLIQTVKLSHELELIRSEKDRTMALEFFSSLPLDEKQVREVREMDGLLTPKTAVTNE